MAESVAAPRARQGEQHHRVQIFLVLCTGLLLTRRGRLPTRRQKLDQSLGDGQAVRWAAVDRWATERASARAPQPPRPSGYATLSGDGSSGGPDRRCLTGLLPLDGSEHPVPGLRLRGLSGERRRTGILPRHGSGLPPVHIDHVAGEIQIVGIIDHYGCLVDYRVERWRRKWQGRSPLPPYGEAMPFPPRLGSSSTLVIHAVRRRDRCTLGLRPVPPGEGCVVARQGQLSTLHRHSRGTTLIGKLRCGSSAPLPLGESGGEFGQGRVRTARRAAWMPLTETGRSRHQQRGNTMTSTHKSRLWPHPASVRGQPANRVAA